MDWPHLTRGMNRTAGLRCGAGCHAPAAGRSTRVDTAGLQLASGMIRLSNCRHWQGCGVGLATLWLAAALIWGWALGIGGLAVVEMVISKY